MAFGVHQPEKGAVMAGVGHGDFVRSVTVPIEMGGKLDFPGEIYLIYNFKIIVLKDKLRMIIRRILAEVQIFVASVMI